LQDLLVGIALVRRALLVALNVVLKLLLLLRTIEQAIE